MLERIYWRNRLHGLCNMEKFLGKILRLIYIQILLSKLIKNICILLKILHGDQAKDSYS